MNREMKLRAIRQVLGRESFCKGDEAVFFCVRPSCNGFRKPKLSVNLKTDVFHCWKCDHKGKNLLSLMKKGSKEREEYLKTIEESQGKKKEIPERKYDTPVLPKEFKTLSKPSSSPYYHGAMEYLAGRGVCADDIVRWKLGYCEEGDYGNRIIVPSFDEYGELNFFVGRAFYTNPRSYKHGNFDKDIVFNDYWIDWGVPIVVTEGPFDAITAGENAVPLQGTIMGDTLFRKIVSSGVDVYFALDTDAFSKQLKIIKRLLEYGVDSYYVNLGGKKDVGSMTRHEFQSARERAFHVRSSLDLLKVRIAA